MQDAERLAEVSGQEGKQADLERRVEEQRDEGRHDALGQEHEDQRAERLSDEERRGRDRREEDRTQRALLALAPPAPDARATSDVESAIGSRTPFASVRAVPTGRETSDGWAELSTGPIDASVWGVPA